MLPTFKTQCLIKNHYYLWKIILLSDKIINAVKKRKYIYIYDFHRVTYIRLVLLFSIGIYSLLYPSSYLACFHPLNCIHIMIDYLSGLSPVNNSKCLWIDINISAGNIRQGNSWRGLSWIIWDKWTNYAYRKNLQWYCCNVDIGESNTSWCFVSKALILYQYIPLGNPIVFHVKCIILHLVIILLDCTWTSYWPCWKLMLNNMSLVFPVS